MENTDYTVNLGETPFTYNGSEQRPDVIFALTDAGREKLGFTNTQKLEQNKDYYISYNNAVNAGTFNEGTGPNVTVGFMGDYSGTSSPHGFSIAKKALSDSNLTVYFSTTKNGSSVVYNNSTEYVYHTVQIPNVRVAWTEDEDENAVEHVLDASEYTVKYGESEVCTSENAGSYSVMVTFPEGGNYTGSLTENYSITPRGLDKLTISLDQNSFVYDGTEKGPVVTVMDGSNVLTRTTKEGDGNDYKLSAEGTDGQNVGEYTFSLEAGDNGNYSGGETTNTATWSIIPATPKLTVKSGTQLYLIKNETKTIEVTADAPELSYTYSSNNPDVATVSNGEIKAVKPGSATITITNGSGNTNYNAAYAYVSVVVTEKPTQSLAVTLENKNITNFSAANPVLTYEPNLTATISATATKADSSQTATLTPKISYESSNKGVATVNNGTITIVGAGTTSIIVKSEDTAGNYATTTASVVLTVKPAVVDVAWKVKGKEASSSETFIMPYSKGKQGVEPVLTSKYNGTEATEAKPVENNPPVMTNAEQTDAGTYVARLLGLSDSKNYVLDANAVLSQSYTISPLQLQMNVTVDEADLMEIMNLIRNPSNAATAKKTVAVTYNTNETGGSDLPVTTSDLPATVTTGDGKLLSVKGDELTLAGNGATTITVTPDANPNYTVEAVTKSVNVIYDPIVSLTVDNGNPNVSAKLNKQTGEILVAGIAEKNAEQKYTITVTPAVATGMTVNPVTIQSDITTAQSVTVTDGTSTVATYTLTTSLKELPSNTAALTNATNAYASSNISTTNTAEMNDINSVAGGVTAESGEIMNAMYGKISDFQVPKDAKNRKFDSVETGFTTKATGWETGTSGQVYSFTTDIKGRLTGHYTDASGTPATAVKDVTTFDSPVTITQKLSGGMDMNGGFVVRHGNAPIHSEVSNGSISFETQSFSPFTVTNYPYITRINFYNDLGAPNAATSLLLYIKNGTVYTLTAMDGTPGDPGATLTACTAREGTQFVTWTASDGRTYGTSSDLTPDQVEALNALAISSGVVEQAPYGGTIPVVNLTATMEYKLSMAYNVSGMEPQTTAAQYTVNGGTATYFPAETLYLNSGDTVTVTVDQYGKESGVNQKYQFSNWEPTGVTSGTTDNVTFSFTMPKQPVSLKANYSQIKVVVTIQTEGQDGTKGTFSYNGTNDLTVYPESEGTLLVMENAASITAGATPKAGYEFLYWMIQPKNGDTITLSAASLDHTVNATQGDLTLTAYFKAAGKNNVKIVIADNTLGDANITAKKDTAQTDTKSYDFDPAEASADYVTIKATPMNTGVFKEWKITKTDGSTPTAEEMTAVKSGDTLTINKLTVDVIVTPVFEKATSGPQNSNSGGSYHSSTGSSTGTGTTNTVVPGATRNGSVRISDAQARPGQTVTVTVDPRNGYEVGGVKITDKNGNPIDFVDNGDGTYTFTVPNNAVLPTRVEATFVPEGTSGAISVDPGYTEPVNTQRFEDVPADAYYAPAVDWAFANAVTNGVDADHFGPTQNCTRAQFVTFLWRAAGSPEPMSTRDFTDVDAGSHSSYYSAIQWAAEQGITTGTGDGSTFSPDDTVTRGQAVTFLYRYAKEMTAGADSGFVDVDSSAYYADAVAWALSHGITNGNSATENTFGPNDFCTRAQMITFLYRMFTGARG